MGIDKEKINSLSNFTILPSNSNKVISDKAPADYFFNIIPKNHYKKILKSNLLPLNSKIYKKDKDYAEFLDKRAEVLLAAIDDILVRR